jgi:hypothetical protein
MDNQSSDNLKDSINDSSIAIKCKLYQQSLANKNHTLHCLIQKYKEYFMHEYTIWEINRCKGKFGCQDVNIQNATPQEFDLKMKESCSYNNQEFIQYEAQASVDLAILELYRTG